MRTAFINTLFEMAKNDKNIHLVVGDLGFGVVTQFMKELPDQFVNVGVAEQNMTGIAAGMAMSGKIVFTYSIANFPTIRCLEQIRNDVCYHRANVIITSVGGGLCYGPLGASHHATEDIAIMRAIPNMMVVAPGDPVEVSLAVDALIRNGGPAYLRLGRAKEPFVHKSTPSFNIGKAITVSEGKDLTIISTGGLLFNAVEAAHELNRLGIGTGVISMHTVKPIDKEAVLQAAKNSKAIVTLEEHSTIGGLGGAVSEILLEEETKPKYFKRIGLNDYFSSIVGDQDYLRAHYGLGVSGIVKTVLYMLNR